MRVEVAIGTIVVDALPPGVTVEGLRAEIVSALAAEIRAGAVPGLTGGPAVLRGDVAGGASQALAGQIVRGIVGEPDR